MPKPLTLEDAVQAADKSVNDTVCLEGIPYRDITDKPQAPPKIRIQWIYDTVPPALKFHFLAANLRLLMWYEMYESLFLDALTGARTNHHHVDLEAQRFLLSHCRRPKLRFIGDPFEEGQPGFAIYRGVAGEDEDARPAGLSWTRSLDVAAFFALHNALAYNLSNPRVYMSFALPVEILACTNRRREEEVVINQVRAMTNLSLTDDTLKYRADAQRQAWRREFGRLSA